MDERVEQTEADELTALEIAIGSRHLRVFRRGDGPVNVVFEAGGGCGADVWHAVQHLLTDKITSWSYDRAGEGSSPSNGDWCLDASLDDLEAWLTAVDVSQPVVLVGHSLGCHIVRAYAARHPDAVTGMVLIDARPPGFEQRVLDAGIPIAMPPPETSIVREIGRADEAIVGLPSPGGAPPIVMCSEHFDAAPGELSDSEVADVAALWRTAQAEIAQAVGQPLLSVVPGTGHAIPVEAPQHVASVISDLVDGL